MHIANYFLQGEVTHAGLPQWLAEQIGLFGNTPEAVQLIIWVNSNGGDLLAAIEAINLMKASSIPVTTIVNGSAESAALLVAMAGHTRLAFPSSWGMAHHFSTAMEGSYHDLMDSVKHNEILNEEMTVLIQEHSSLDDETIADIMLGRKTTWLSATDLLEAGLIDAVIDPTPDLRERLLHNAYSKETQAAQRP